MALNYSAVFQNLGKIVGRSASYASLAATTLPADLQAIVAQFGAGGTSFGVAQAPIEGLPADYASFQANVVSWRTRLQTYVQNVLTDVDTVVSQLPTLTSNPAFAAVLQALQQDMKDKGQSVLANTVTLGAVTAGPGNTGNGTVLLDATLDGVSAPLSGAAAWVGYNGLLSQLAVPSETMELVCTSDSFSGGATEGSEGWQWTGGLSYPLFDYHAEGSGGPTSITTANGQTVLQNLDFETWSANVPGSFTITAGAAGVDVFQETGTPANLFRGASALRFTGTGAAQPTITQALTVGNVKARQRFLFTVMVKTGGVAPGAEMLTIQFTGTGYTAAPSEQINIALAGVPGTYTLYSFYLNFPATIPANMTLSIGITGANLTNGTNVYLDSGSFGPVNYAGGINAVVLAGSTPWTVGDRLSWPVTNTQTGKAQDYFRRAFAAQLPSVSVGNTILEAWFN